MNDYLQRFDKSNPLHAAWFNAVIDRLQKVDPTALSQGSSLDDMWRAGTVTTAPLNQLKPEAQEWKTLIKALNISQPDAVTCQSACIGMAVGDRDVPGIRKKLRATGLEAGDPSAMARVIKTYNMKYEYNGNASLSDVFQWLKNGEFLITHGWFTRSGHVICLDGLFIQAKASRYKINVKDPWSEFDAQSWSYNSNSRFFDGYYSELCIYSACVAGQSAADAASVYKRGYVDRSQRGMWVHRIIP